MFTAICKRIGDWVVEKDRLYLLLAVLCLLGSVTLTANAILTVSNSGMFGDADVTVDSAGTLNVGTASSTAVVIGKTGTPVTIPGNVAINGTLTLGSASTTGQLIFRIASSSFTTLLQASSSQASNLTFTLPTTAGTAGQAMLTDGAGNLFFGNISSSQWLNGTSGTISYSSGSIGINTTTPLALLSIVGSSTSTAPLFDIASSTGASLFRVSPNGNVTIGSTVLPASLPVSILAYGADPAGVANSTAAFTAALIAVPTGGTILFPCGTYLLDPAFSISKAVTILGASSDCTTIKYRGTAATDLLVVASNGVTISDVTIDANSHGGAAVAVALGVSGFSLRNSVIQNAAGSWGCVDLYATSDVTFSNNTVSGCTGGQSSITMRLKSGTPATDLAILDNTITVPTLPNLYGIMVQQGAVGDTGTLANVTIRRNKITFPNDASHETGAIVLAVSTNGTPLASNILIDTNTLLGVGTQTGSNAIELQGIDKVRVTGNYIDNAHTGVKYEYCNSCTVGAMVTQNVFGTGVLTQITATNVTKFQYSSNLLAGGYGIVVTSSSEGSIVGNQITSVHDGTIPIWVNGGTNVSIRANSIIHSNFGLLFQGTNSGVVVGQNYCYDVSNGCYYGTPIAGVNITDDNNGLLSITGLGPTISSGFGTSPSIAGSTAAGRVTVGSGGTASTGVLSFGVTWQAAPACVANDETTNLNVRATAATNGGNGVTTLTLTSASAWGAADKLTFQCVWYKVGL